MIRRARSLPIPELPEASTKTAKQAAKSLFEAARAQHTIIGTITPLDDSEGLT
jgi:hypothetical protein